MLFVRNQVLEQEANLTKFRVQGPASRLEYRYKAGKSISGSNRTINSGDFMHDEKQELFASWTEVRETVMVKTTGGTMQLVRIQPRYRLMRTISVHHRATTYAPFPYP